MRDSAKAWLEVTVVFGIVIGICRILYSFRSVPFIAQTLPLWAAGLFLYVPLLLLFRRRVRPEAWGITLRRFRESMKAFLAFSCFFLPPFVLLYGLYRFLGDRGTLGFAFPEGGLALLVYHLLGVALPEEVFYRGYMQSRLNAVFPRRVNLVVAPVGFGWLYTGLLFALGHFFVSFQPEALGTFFPGLLFGLLRERTGSVVASTAFHAVCNMTVLILV